MAAIVAIDEGAMVAGAAVTAKVVTARRPSTTAAMAVVPTASDVARPPTVARTTAVRSTRVARASARGVVARPATTTTATTMGWVVRVVVVSAEVAVVVAAVDAMAADVAEVVETTWADPLTTKTEATSSTCEDSSAG